MWKTAYRDKEVGTRLIRREKRERASRGERHERERCGYEGEEEVEVA